MPMKSEGWPRRRSHTSDLSRADASPKPEPGRHPVELAPGAKKRPRSLRPAAFRTSATNCLLRKHRLDHVLGAIDGRPDVVHARGSLAATLRLAVPADRVLTLRIPRVGDRLHQL